MSLKILPQKSLFLIVVFADFMIYLKTGLVMMLSILREAKLETLHSVSANVN